MFHSLATNADVFFIEGVGYRAFRRPTVTTTEAAASSIKAEQRRPREERKKKTEEDRGRNPENKEKKNT